MIDVSCPHCGARIAVPLAVTLVSCPQCGATVQVPAGDRGEVIDVRAEVVGEDYRGSSHAHAEVVQPEIIPAAPLPPPPRVKVRTWTYQGGGGSGCCGLGCVFVAVLFALAVQGLFSLF